MKYVALEPLILLDAVARLAPDSTRTTLRSWIKEGRIFLDGEEAKHPNQPVAIGQILTMGTRPRYAPGKLPLLYEDKDLVVIDKPEGLLSVATVFEKGETAHALLKSKYKPSKVYVVHRLDQDTSGVMLFARNEKAQEKIKSLLEKHEIERVYYAIVEGKLKGDGTWESYQYEDKNYLVHNTTDAKKGKRAVTHYLVKEVSKYYSLLEIRLETGRKNQIRAHCQMAGCPVAGDRKYGAKTNPLKRLGLHAHLLKFLHPLSGKSMQFTSPFPKEFFTLFPSLSQ